MATKDELFWNFLLSPFGMCGSVLMETISRKIFTFSWILSWFLVLATFSAEFSATVTVGKLRGDINSFQDVWKQQRNFFWFKAQSFRIL